MGTYKTTKVDYLLLLIVSILVGFVTLQITNLVYFEHGIPYMDEIFHIPQAQLYCKNQWNKWNNKITTLPGLYIVSYVILNCCKVLHVESVCDVYHLRLTNTLGTVLNFITTFLILQKTNSGLKKKVKNSTLMNILSSINIAIFPPLYFFNFLYYTDVWSLAFVLLMYQQHLSTRLYSKVAAALAGSAAVLMRQTNIIWVIFMLLDTMWTSVRQIHPSKGKTDVNYVFGICRIFFSFLPFSKSKGSKYGGFKKFVSKILAKGLPYLLVCIAFAIFVIVNGSIVVGDKEAHTAVFHPMQNLYFIGFAIFFGLPFTFSSVINTFKEVPNIFLVSLLCGLCLVLSETNKLEHPYLLADNRHIAFYIWKRIYGHHLIRRLVVPFYVLGSILLYRLLRHCDLMFVVALVLCTALNLTPQYLFELRYFIIPFVMFRLHYCGGRAIVFETVFFVTLNIASLALFLKRPFKWSSEPDSIQRFIW